MSKPPTHPPNFSDAIAAQIEYLEQLRRYQYEQWQKTEQKLMALHNYQALELTSEEEEETLERNNLDKPPSGLLKAGENEVDRLKSEVFLIRKPPASSASPASPASSASPTSLASPASSVSPASSASSASPASSAPTEISISASPAPTAIEPFSETNGKFPQQQPDSNPENIKRPQKTNSGETQRNQSPPQNIEPLPVEKIEQELENQEGLEEDLDLQAPTEDSEEPDGNEFQYLRSTKLSQANLNNVIKEALEKNPDGISPREILKSLYPDGVEPELRTKIYERIYRIFRSGYKNGSIKKIRKGLFTSQSRSNQLLSEKEETKFTSQSSAEPTPPQTLPLTDFIPLDRANIKPVLNSEKEALSEEIKDHYPSTAKESNLDDLAKLSQRIKELGGYLETVKSAMEDRSPLPTHGRDICDWLDPSMADHLKDSFTSKFGDALNRGVQKKLWDRITPGIFAQKSTQAKNSSPSNSGTEKKIPKSRVAPQHDKKLYEKIARILENFAPQALNAKKIAKLMYPEGLNERALRAAQNSIATALSNHLAKDLWERVRIGYFRAKRPSEEVEGARVTMNGKIKRASRNNSSQVQTNNILLEPKIDFFSSLSDVEGAALKLFSGLLSPHSHPSKLPFEEIAPEIVTLFEAEGNGEILHLNYIANGLFGVGYEQYSIKLSEILTEGEKKGLWAAVPNTPDCWTKDLSLLSEFQVQQKVN